MADPDLSVVLRCGVCNSGLRRKGIWIPGVSSIVCHLDSLSYAS